MKAEDPDKYGIGTYQTQLTGFTNISNRPALFHYDYASSSNAFAEMLSVDHLSFRFAESIGLNTWVSEHLQPAHKSIFRKTAKRRTTDIYVERKKQICQYILWIILICMFQFVVIFGVIIGKHIRIWVLHVITLTRRHLPCTNEF